MSTQTCECVLPGHPDKVCDLISDTVVEDALLADPESHVACEVFAAGRNLVVGGEISCTGVLDIQSAVSRALGQAGYERWDPRLHVFLNQQSPDINDAVSHSIEERSQAEGLEPYYDVLGAGDQGIVYGAACAPVGLRGNDRFRFNLLPFSHWAAAALARALHRWTQDNRFIGPDGKVQITAEDTHTATPSITTVLISIQHREDLNLESLADAIWENVVRPTLSPYLYAGTEFIFNPSGRFVLGGPEADSGLTGRKTQVDTYGGVIPHGGGAFSGKDPTKVDRSAAYYARYAAKNIVAAGLANNVIIQVAYAIGKAAPVSLILQAEDASCGVGHLQRLLHDRSVFDFRPGAIIDQLRLQDTRYTQFTNFGHFTDNEAAWERLDLEPKILESISRPV